MNKEELENKAQLFVKNHTPLAKYTHVERLVMFAKELTTKQESEPQQTVSKEIQFIKHTLKAIIRWHRDQRNPKNFPISSTLDALNYLDRLQAQTNEGELIEVAEMLELNINKLKKLIPC